MNMRFFLTFLMVLSVTFAFCQNRTYNINDNEEYTLTGSISEIPSLKNSLRLREFRINPVLQQADLIQKNDTIILNLFEDCTYTAYVTGISKNITGTTMINGCLNDYKFSSFFISTSEGKSFIQVDIPEKEELYAVNYNHEQGTYYLKQLDYIKNEKPSEGKISPDNNDENEVNKLQSNTNLRVTDTQETLTLLIAYTPETVNWSKKNATDINNVIDIIMAKNQLVLDNSQTNVTIKLVCAVEVDYKEVDMGTDFDHFGTSDDGFMDEVHALRDYYYADMMLFVSGMRYYGGLGCVFNGGEGWAFAVTDPSLATFGYTGIHELGHVMGCRHYKTTYENPPANAYNYGWAWHDPSDDGYYCSVMTYGGSDGWPDNIGRKRLPYFSNPNVKHNGIATGDSKDGDNARRIRDTKSAIAKFRVENCTKPSKPVVDYLSQPNCTSNNSSVTLSNLPNDTWTLLRLPDNKIFKGSGSSITIIDTGSGDFNYTVIDSKKCPSPLSNTISIIESIPDIPVIEEVIQPNCTRSYGKIKLSNLPKDGEITMYASGSDYSKITGYDDPYIMYVNPGTYSFITKSKQGCLSPETEKIEIIAAPVKPDKPVVKNISHPCTSDKGYITLENLPSEYYLVYYNGKADGGTSSSSYSLTLSPGSYDITVKTLNGCMSDPVQAIINPPGVPDIPQINVTQPTCTNRESNVEISQLPDSGTMYIYNSRTLIHVDDFSTTSVNIVLPAERYYVFVKNSSGCSSENSEKFTVNSPPVIPQKPKISRMSQPGCLDAKGEIVLYNLSRASWQIYSIINSTETLIQEGNSSTTRFQIEPGSYDLFVKNSSGCLSPEVKVVISNPPSTPPPPEIDNIIHPTCTNPIGKVQLSQLPGDGKLYVYTNEGNSKVNYTTSPVQIDLEPGSYSFAAQNWSGCYSDKTNEIVINPQNKPDTPVISVIDHPDCNEDKGTIFLNNLPSKPWLLYEIEGSQATLLKSGSDSFASLETAPGSHDLSVRFKSGCYSDTINLLVNNPPTTPGIPVIDDILQPTCSKPGIVQLSNLPDNGKLTIHSEAGNSSITYTSSPINIDLEPGNYSFSVTNLECESQTSNTIDIDEHPVVDPPVIEITRHPSCSDPSGLVSVSHLPDGDWTLTRLPDNKVFTGSGTITEIDDIPPGTYSYNVTNSELCISRNSENFNLFQISLIPQPTITQKGLILSASPADSYQWYLSNEPIEGATKKDYTVIKEGEYHVVVYDDQCYSKPSDKLYITINGIGDIKAGLKVYPNPPDSELSLELPGNNEPVHVDIFSASGELLYSSEFTNSINIDVKQWPSGIYIIKSFNNKFRFVNKFVKN